jgi:hypothetical protein
MKPTAVPDLHSTQALALPEAPKGSQRRKLWDLPPQAQCPVVGVCLALPRLRLLLKKACHTIDGMGPYECHLLAVHECRRHSRLAEIVQRELDRQFDLTVQSMRSVRDESVLLEHWREASGQGAWASMFWTVITHPSARLSTVENIIGEVHMLQHQVGMSTRVDQTQALQRQQALKHVQAQRDALQKRWQAEQLAWARKQEALQQQVQAQQERAAQAEAEVTRLNKMLAAWRPSDTDPDRVAELESEVEWLRSTVSIMDKALRRTEATADSSPLLPVAPESPSAMPEGWQWLQRPSACGLARARRLVCVGGGQSMVPLYRKAAESAGIDFVHHDGGLEQKLQRLDRVLAHADLVICQTGCISHNAYWRVKEHCKRTGKACAFVGNPSPQVIRQVIAEALCVSAPAVQDPVCGGAT